MLNDPFLPSWSRVVVESLQNSWSSVVAFLPLIITAVIVFVFGWLVASALGTIIAQAVRALKVDALLQRLEVEKALERGGLRLNSGAFIGGLVKWFVIIVALLAATNILGLGDVGGFLSDVLRYVPNVAVAALILLIALKVAEVVERTARASVEAAGMSGAVVGVVARWAIWVSAAAAALIQLGVAKELLLTFVGGFVNMLAVGLGLAFGLAFGLGGKDAAAGFIEKLRRDIAGR